MAAMTTCCLCIKVYDWLRLFDRTAFYVRLIESTIYDIRYFFILLLVAIGMFGLPIKMLNYFIYPDNELIADHSENSLFNMLMNQYLLALGEFDIDNYLAHPNTILCFTFFILATAFTQITMLNMLIAIMSDTFDKVT